MTHLAKTPLRQINPFKVGISRVKVRFFELFFSFVENTPRFTSLIRQLLCWLNFFNLFRWLFNYSRLPRLVSLINVLNFDLLLYLLHVARILYIVDKLTHSRFVFSGIARLTHLICYIVLFVLDT